MMGLGSGIPGAVTGDPDPQGGRLDDTAHGGIQDQGFAVDPDRDLGGVGVDDHLGPGQAGQPLCAAPA